jgi:hypothetical protein
VYITPNGQGRHEPIQVVLKAGLSACRSLEAKGGAGSGICGSKAVLGGFEGALGFGLGSGPPTGYREGCTAHSTDTETPQNTVRIDRKAAKVPICRVYRLSMCIKRF